MIHHHQLDPVHFIGLPSFSQAAMLYKTNKKLHLIPKNVELSKLISQNLRGGFSGVINKISTNLIENPSESKYICGIDINNLYGYSMIQKLANKFVSTLSAEQFEKEEKDLEKFAYFCEVTYTLMKNSMTNFLNFLLISKKQIKESDLSLDQKEANSMIKSSYKSEKLCATLEDCTEPMLISYENILFYQRHGYEFKFYQVHKFEVEFIMKDYIDFNTSLRQKSKNELEKNLFKLLNNICYGRVSKDQI
jgi:hypothetical protein